MSVKALNIAIILLLLLFSAGCRASSIEVTKYIDGGQVNAGADTVIYLKFSNPFGREVPIKIVDKSVFAGDGLDIQCLEYTLPNQSVVAVSYPAVKAYTPGKYTLDAASVSYTNPETGKEETVKSNTFDVVVNGSASSAVQAQGVTTVYSCGGVSMQSTSFSSTQSGGQQGQQQQGQQQQSQQPDNPQSRVQNNQMNQNTNAVKQEIDKQKQQEQAMTDQFNKNLENNSEFRKEQQKLQDQGYKSAGSGQQPFSNDSGAFQRSFQKQDGGNASIQGQMKGGQIENMKTETSEEKQRAIDALKNDTGFKDLAKQMEKQGMQEALAIANKTSQNDTKVTVQYKNQSTGEEKNITADYVNGSIKNLKVVEQNKADNNNLLLLIAGLVVLIVLSYVSYKKFFKKKTAGAPEVVAEEKEPYDYVDDAKKMLSEAERLYNDKREKDAYEKVSQAVRTYYSYKAGSGEELTGAELVKMLKKQGAEYREAERCLSLCSMVEFAKYRANYEDFGEILTHAKNMIV